MKHIQSYESIKPKPAFKIGDKVICIDAPLSNRIKLNGIYTIDKIQIGVYFVGYTLEELPGTEWNQIRFRAATQEEISIDKYNL